MQKKRARALEFCSRYGSFGICRPVQGGKAGVTFGKTGEMAVRRIAVLLKVYAALYPAEEVSFVAVRETGKEAIGVESPWLFHEGDMLRIAWEGIFFPVESILADLEKTLLPRATGKLDYLDLEAWTLTRYSFIHGRFTAFSRSLNHVLEYSGH